MDSVTIKVNKTAIFLAGGLIVGLALGYYGGVWRTTAKASNNPAPQVVAGNTDTQQPAQPAQPTITMDAIRALFNSDNVSLGNKKAKLYFVEIADPSCPYCSIASGKNPELNKQAGAQFVLVADGGSYVAPVPEMKKLADSGQAAFVWIYANGHGNGEMGAKALYCANEKGKFWQAEELLMSGAGYDLLNNTVKNDKTKSGELATFLKSAVDYNFMKGCLDSGKYDARLTADAITAQSLGFGGTPDFFVNTVNFEGAYSYTDMQSAVNAALQ